MTDLETRLRTMLRERAGDVTTLPTELIRFDDAPTHRRPRTGWLVAAAVAAVLAVTGSVVAVRSIGGGHGAAPATHAPATVPKPTPAAKIEATCVGTLPSSWSSALADDGTTFGARSALPLAATGGGVLVARDFGQRRDVVLVAHGRAPRWIFTVPDPDRNTVEHATLEGRWALIPVEYLPRTAVSIVPSVVEVDLVDLDTGAVRTLDRAPIVIAKDGEQGRTIDGATMQDGSVYWDLRPKYGSDAGIIRQYDIGTGTTRTIYTGPVTAPQASVAGVSWRGDPSLGVQVRAHLIDPRPIPGIGSAVLSSDGSSFAWPVGDDVVGWWSRGTGLPRYLRFPAGHRPSPDAMRDLLVAGPIVSVDDYLLDTRSGAVAQLPSRFRAGGATMSTFLFAGGGVLVGYQLPGADKQAPTAVVELDTRRLPELRC